jgi:outer membrane phospholipase A
MKKWTRRSVFAAFVIFTVLPRLAGAQALYSNDADDVPAAQPDDALSIDVPKYLDNLLSGPSTKAAASPALEPGPGTQPATQPLYQPETNTERSLAEFLGQFSAYEPIYFIAGPYNPLAKFQFSFKFRLFNQDAPVVKQLPLLGGLYFSYTQLSLWQLNLNSAPFYDSNYMPEFFYSNEDIKAIKLPGVTELGLQTGYGHDSNGEHDGPTKRGLNILFIRPIVNFGDPEAFHFYIAPKAYVYIFNLDDNRTIAKYRGYCDLRTVAGWRQGLELSFIGRIGSDYNKGSVQFDLSYPIRDLLNRNLDLYIDAQYFNGYGESLITYRARTQAFRIGIGLAR